MKRSKYFKKRKAADKPHIYLSARYKNTYTWDQLTLELGDRQWRAGQFCMNVRSPVHSVGLLDRPWNEVK